jgi:CNP1-like family
LKSVFQSSGARVIARGFAAPAAAIVAALSLGACSSPALDQGPKPGQDFVYLLDRNQTWEENKVDKLPPLPQTADLLPFEASATTSLNFAIDAKSVSVGTDGVVRYTVVITSTQGARNVYYEGVRCDTYEWRRYAAADDAGTNWDRGASNDWRRIENSELNAYQAALYQDYMCANKLPQGKAETIVRNIRYKRIASSRYQ